MGLWGQVWTAQMIQMTPFDVQHEPARAGMRD